MNKPIYFSVADECRNVILNNGISWCRVQGQRGSHTAYVWIADKERELFESRFVNKCYKSKYHEFYFQYCTNGSYVSPYYLVSYKLIK